MRRVPCLAVVQTVFAGGLLINIGAPFLRHHESVDTQYATMARNQVRLGYRATRLGSYTISAPDERVYSDWRLYVYPNRPPLSVFVTSLWFRVFGDAEWVLRLSLIAVGLGTLTAFAALARKLLTERWKGIALAAFAFFPIFWYFTVVAVHLAYALCFSVSAWACWVRWEEARRYRVLAFLFLFLACESDWPGYFAVLSVSADACFRKRWLVAGGFLGMSVACFGLHLLHIYWIDPEHGPMVRIFLRGGWDRSAEWRPSLGAYAKSQTREVGLYFTAGAVLLAAVGARRLSRQMWLLGFLGLDEVVFSAWAHHHDYLTYSLTPFFAVAVAKGVEALWTTKCRKAIAGALLAMAALQSIWITGDRLIRQGASEASYLAATAIHETAKPLDRVLITIADERLFIPYYADRYTAGLEREGAELVVHWGRRGPVVERVEDLERYFPDFSMVLVGDPDAAAREIRFFRGARPPAGFRFLAPDHSLRARLESIAISKEKRGAFILYRLR